MRSYADLSCFKPANQNPIQQEKPQVQPSSIYIVATGGTIAGVAASATSATYDPSQLKISQVVDAIPEINNLRERIKTVDLMQVNSEDLTSADWLSIAKKVNELLQLPDVKGVVITHGTDTLEETAYFLDLVIKSNKPVVMVGAMRAATSLSADGPLNLYNALAVVHDSHSVGRGVMVLMNDTLFDGRDVTKCNTTQVNTFNAPNSGPIGHVNYGKVSFERRVERRNTTATPFDITHLTTLPTVEIITEYAGSTGNVLKAVIAQKPDGIVIAGVGNGNLTAPDRALIRYAQEQGIKIVRSSRTGSGRVTETYDDMVDNVVAGDNLNPQKARILLMLSLTQTIKDVNELRTNFALY